MVQHGPKGSKMVQYGVLRSNMKGKKNKNKIKNGYNIIMANIVLLNEWNEGYEEKYFQKHDKENELNLHMNI